MKNLCSLAGAFVVATLCSTAFTALGQEALSREDAMKYAFLVALHEPASMQAPIKVDADLKRPFAGHDGDYGAMVLPETKLTAATLQAAGRDVLPLGQLWLVKLTPMVNGSGVEASSLQIVRIPHDGETVRAPLCLLGVRKTEAGSLELFVYGRGKEPLLRVPLSKTQRTQTMPIELTGERESDGGKLKLSIVGQYEAEIPVTELQD